jgi:tetratricopeptide (TPR) repeat protein
MNHICVAEVLCEALGYHKNERLEKAQNLYEKVLRYYPDQPEAHHGLGLIALNDGRPDKAYVHIREAVKKNPKQGQYRVSLIHARIALKDFKAAWQELETVRAIGLQVQAVKEAAASLQQAYADKIVMLFNAGKYHEAQLAAQNYVKKYPQHAFGYKAAGTILCKRGETEDALRMLERAIDLEADAETLHAYATALQDSGRLEEALAGYNRALKLCPDYAEAHNKKATVLQKLGQDRAALEHYETAIQFKPTLAEAYYNKANLLKKQGKLDEALDNYQKTLEIKPQYPDAHNNMGNVLREAHRLQDAIASYTKAIEIDPDYCKGHNNLANVLQELGKAEEAVQSYKRALKINPDFPEAYNNMGNALVSLDKEEKALVCYKKATELKPDYGEAHGNLCDILEKTNQTAKVRDYLDNLPSLDSVPLNLVLVKARLLRRQDKLVEAKEILENVDAELQVAHRGTTGYWAELGAIYDRLGAYEKAFDAFAKSNQVARCLFGRRGVFEKTFNKRVEALLEKFGQDWTGSWATPLERLWSPVFLVGFPRSGTTLVDTILRSHPDAAVTEEKPILGRVKRAVSERGGWEPDGKRELKKEEIVRFRDIYREELDAHLTKGEREASVKVDKFPLNMVDAGLIHRVFPEARFVLVLRHPCDCVLSCFMQNFEPNSAMANFLNLEKSARFYDLVMRLWERYTSLFPLNVQTVRYEDLVADFEGSVDSLLEFLGLSRCEEVNGYYETARERKRIKTPSYHQVTQPIYQRAKGRWNNYKEQMAPVLPRLMPWAGHWGYGW